MDPLDVGRVAVGMVLLILGGEVLVRGAAALAVRVGISPLVVGLTVVAAATSSQELAVALGAGLRGESGLSLGNVVGANVLNVLFIVGVCALVTPLAVTRQLMRLDLPVMVALSGGLLLVSLDGRISTLDGAVLFGAALVHTVLTVVVSRRTRGAPAPATGPAARLPARGGVDEGEEWTRPAPIGTSLVLVVTGVGLLVAGAMSVVGGAVDVATGLGVSSLVVGLTVVAVGTTLPELTASLVSVLHGERDLAVGVVVGSCILNIGVVISVPSLLFTSGVPVPPAAMTYDLPVMVATAVALLAVAFTDSTVARWEGALLLVLYLAYTGFIVLAATEHDALDGFTAVLAWFVLPVTAATLLLFTAREVRSRGGRAGAGRAADPP
jgi:cation:H+ antiporter